MNIMGWILFVQFGASGITHTADTSPYIFRSRADCIARGERLVREAPYFTFSCKYGHARASDESGRGAIITLQDEPQQK